MRIRSGKRKGYERIWLDVMFELMKVDVLLKF